MRRCHHVAKTEELVARNPLLLSSYRNVFLGFESLPHRQFHSIPLATRQRFRGSVGLRFHLGPRTESLPHRQFH